MKHICTNCGAELQEGARFCANCGTKQPNVQPEPTPQPESISSPGPIPNNVNAEAKRKKKMLLIGVGVLDILLVLAAIWWFFLRTPSGDVDYSLIPVGQSADDHVKYGYVDHKGKMVINPQFEEAYVFSDGLALVCNEEGKYGFIDKKGKFVMNCEFVSATGFSEGLAFVVREGETPTCITTSGKEKFKCSNDVDRVSSFKDGLACFENTDGKYGYMNTKGEVVINPQFNQAYDFSEGMATVSNSDGKYGYINKKGEIVINYQFSQAGGFYNGLAPFCTGNNWGYINKKGEYVINPQFDEASAFIGDYAFVKSGGSWGIIDEEGKYLANPQFKGLAGSVPGALIAAELSDKYGFVDESGKIIINPQFDLGLFLEKDFAVVNLDDQWGFIDRSGKYICNPQFETLGEMWLKRSARSDYYDASKIIAALFQDWTRDHMRDGISNSTSYRQVDGGLSGSLNYDDVTWSSSSIELCDEASLRYSLAFNRKVRTYNYSYDYWYGYNSSTSYDYDAKVIAASFDISLSGKAYSHADFVAKQVAGKLASIYDVRIESQTVDGSEVYYSLDGPIGLMITHSYGQIEAIVSYSKDINNNLKNTILNATSEAATEDELWETVDTVCVETVEEAVEDDWI